MIGGILSLGTDVLTRTDEASPAIPSAAPSGASEGNAVRPSLFFRWLGSATLTSVARSDLLALAFLSFSLGVMVVGAHIHSIWMDSEFTGCVYPIANRLGAGHRLYEDGLHLPMPPLPFVLTHILSQGHAIWLTESVLIIVFQSLAVCVLYLSLARRASPA